MSDLRLTKKQVQPVCDWHENADLFYETDCGHAFMIESDTPSKNDFKFCCFCGKPLVEHLYEQ